MAIQLKLIASLVAVLALAGTHWKAYDLGKNSTNAKWLGKSQKADEALRRVEFERDGLALNVARLSRDIANATASEARTETAKSQERIRYVTREVPANCPVGLDPRVSIELDTAILRANAADD